MMAKSPDYHALYKASEARWNALRSHLQYMTEHKKDENGRAVTYDVNTLLQVIFHMDTQNK